MNQEILVQLLGKEEKLHQICEAAEEHLHNLKLQKQELEDGLTLTGRWLPFAQRREKDWIADYRADIAKAQAACENARLNLKNYLPLARETVRDWLESKEDPEYRFCLTIRQAIADGRDSLEQFRKLVEQLLTAIAEARDAISFSSNHGSRNQSDQAEERIRTAIRAASAVDRAALDLNGRRDEFATTAAGSFYDTLSLPGFSQSRYEMKLQVIAEEKIGPALQDVEALLGQCHRLHDEELVAAQASLAKLEREYERLTDAYVAEVTGRMLKEIQAEPGEATA